MKTLHRFSLLLCLFATLSFAACGDDDTDPNEDVNNRLEGDWKVESFTRDGVEQMNFVYNRFLWEFDKDGPVDGEIEWDITLTNGSSSSSEFDYEVTDEGDELEIEGDDFNIDLDDDDLRLEGTVDAENWIFRLEKD